MKAGIALILVLSLAMSSVWWMAPSTVLAQSELDHLERQIRQWVGTPESPPTETPRAGGNTESGYLGLSADDRQDRGRGVRVLSVQPGTPAEHAGLRQQNLITALAGTRVRQMSDMSEILATFGPGQGLDVDILRDGKPRQVWVVLGTRPVTVPERGESPEIVPPPAGVAIPPPPEPQPAGASRIEQLERRIDELERRVDELERSLKAIRKD